MYACMHACMYVCMYLCMYACMYLLSAPALSAGPGFKVKVKGLKLRFKVKLKV